MKCLSCQAKGKHFDKKICPPCKDNGITRDDVKVTQHKMKFVGKSPGKDAEEFVAEMRAEGKNISHVRERFISHKYDPSKNELHLSWSEYELKDRGGSDGKRKTD